MGRLVIRQETQLQILKQSSAWWVYLQPGANGPIPVLFKAAEKYKEQAKTKFMEAPIRAVLLSTLFLTLSHCRQSLSTDANQQKSARDKGWLTQGNEWCYQKWDAENQVLQIDETHAPVPHQELIGLVSKIAELVTHRDVVHRFNATHPITADKEGVSTDWPASPRSGGHLERPGETCQFGSLTDHRHANPQGGPPTRGAGQRSPEASSSVLRFTLHDPAHQSYINAFVQTYLWCFSLLQVPEFQVFGSRVQAWRDVLYSTQAHLVVSRMPA